MIFLPITEQAGVCFRMLFAAKSRLAMTKALTQLQFGALTGSTTENALRMLEPFQAD